MTKKIPLIDFNNSKPDLRKKEEPLVSIRVTNPITYLKSWWKRVMGKEGVDFHFKIKPLTTIAMTIVIATIGFGVGKFSITPQKPFIKYIATPTPTPEAWRDTAFSGTLRFSSLENRYYLLTNSSEAINISVLENVKLKPLIGRRIFATGKYNPSTHLLIIHDASDLELLPKEIETIPVVTTSPTPTPTPLPTTTPTPISTQSGNLE